MNAAIQFATRAEMRTLGAEWGRAAGAILAEETLGTSGPLAPELADARSAAVLAAIADMAAKLRAHGCRDRQILAFKDSAVRAVADALDAAQVTVAATGAPH